MTAAVILGALVVFTLYYVTFLTRVRLGLAELPRQQMVFDDPTVSVIVAARNEEKTLPACLDALGRLEYPKGRLELIVVDDRSTDGTGTLAREATRRIPGLRVIAYKPADGENGGKTAALGAGIAAAKGEIILTTDADCIPPPTWVRTMVAFFSPKVAIVSGPVHEETPHTLFGGMESLEFLGLITVGAGLIGAKRPIVCNGANLAYRRAAFEAVGGFGGTNDDDALMNRIVHRRIGIAAFAADRNATVQTRSGNSLVSFFRQRVRWAGKKRRYEDPGILLTLVLLYGFFLTLIATAVVSYWEPKALFPLAMVVLGKAVVEWFVLRSGARLTGTPVRFFPFLVAEALHAPYIVFAAALGQFVSMKWRS